MSDYDPKLETTQKLKDDVQVFDRHIREAYDRYVTASDYLLSLLEGQDMMVKELKRRHECP